MRNLLLKFKNLFNLKSEMEVMLKDAQYNNKVAALNHLVINEQSTGISSEKYCEHTIIVSLTTYSKRLDDVYLTIESLMQQTRKANLIILWLADEYRNQNLPMSLQLQQKRGLEIRFCKDLGSYKKLIPSLRDFPNDVIITVDDDAIYNFDMLDRLIVGYLDDPNYIYFNRGHKMKFSTSGALESYANWDWYEASNEKATLSFATGVGGVLYPPGCFNEEVFNENVFMDICRYADDVWFKAMGLLNGTISRKVCTRDTKGEEYLENSLVQDIALGHINNSQNRNDIQIKAVFDRYGLYNQL